MGLVGVSMRLGQFALSPTLPDHLHHRTRQWMRKGQATSAVSVGYFTLYIMQGVSGHGTSRNVRETYQNGLNHPTYLVLHVAMAVSEHTHTHITEVASKLHLVPHTSICSGKSMQRKSVTVSVSDADNIDILDGDLT